MGDGHKCAMNARKYFWQASFGPAVVILPFSIGEMERKGTPLLYSVPTIQGERAWCLNCTGSVLSNVSRATKVSNGKATKCAPEASVFNRHPAIIGIASRFAVRFSRTLCFLLISDGSHYLKQVSSLTLRSQTARGRAHCLRIQGLKLEHGNL